MRLPLRYQLLLPMIGILLFTLCSVSLCNAYLSAVQTRTRMEARLREAAQILVDLNFPLSNNVLQQAHSLSGAELTVTDDSGKVFAASRDEPIPLPGHWEAVHVEHIRLKRVTLSSGGPYYHAAVRLRTGPSSTGPSVLHLFYPEQSFQEAWRHAVYPPLLIGLIVFLPTVLLAAAVALRLTRPIRRLQEQVEQIARGKFSSIPVPKRNDELRDLAESVNRMAEMLDRYEQEVRRSERLRTLGQLGGGIAHQMRNSVTGCRMALDLHRRAAPPQTDLESLDVAVRQLELMERYLRRFLTLGHPGSPNRTPIELGSLVENVLPLVQPTARHMGVTIQQFQPPEPIELAGDADALEQLLVNLLLNALDAVSSRGRLLAIDEAGQAGSSDGRIELHLGRIDEGRVFIEVRDNGPGPDTDIQDRLFEPLVTEKPDGTGLGLTVVRETAEQHGGSVTWHREEGMTCFYVELAADGSALDAETS